MQGDDSTEVNLFFELKSKMLQDTFCYKILLNNYFLLVNCANCVTNNLLNIKNKTLIFKIINLTELKDICKMKWI